MTEHKGIGAFYLPGLVPADEWPGISVGHEGACGWQRYVPERTCRLAYDSVHADYVCSSCGEWLEDTDYDAYAGEERVRRPYRFCPSCGAKVVGR